MARLTKALKAEIVTAALDKAGVTKAQRDSEAQFEALAEAVRLHSFGGREEYDKLVADVGEINALIDALPRVADVGRVRLARSRGYAEAAFGGMRADLQFAQDEHGNRYRPTRWGSTLLAADHPLTAEFHAATAEQERVDEWRAETSATVRAQLDAFGTVEKLLKAWPEAAELMPAEVEKPCTAVAVPVKELNELLGLGGGV